MIGKAYIDELEVKVEDHCRVWWESLCRLEAALLEMHCCLERGSFSGLRREQSRRRHQKRRCDLAREAC